MSNCVVNPRGRHTSHFHILKRGVSIAYIFKQLFPSPERIVFVMKNFQDMKRNQTTYSEDSINKRRNCNQKLKSSFTKLKRINPDKITIAIQYRHKKRCTNSQDRGEMKPLLKKKLKDRLQRTRQSARNKESRTLGLEAIGKLCRQGRIIYYSSK